MMHIEIENFQSIKNLSFDINGFTTLVGRNFHGKSATLRAINAALTNKQGTDFIRWGEKFCEVRIKTDKIDLVWHKESGNNFYKINGNDYLKIGSQPPPNPVLDAGYGVLNVSGEKIDLLYAEQFFPLFLVNKRDSKSADLLISIYGLDRLYKAVDLCDKDRKKNKDLLKLRKGDRDIAERNLDRFKNIDEVLAKIDSLKELKDRIDEEQRQLDKLKVLADKLVSCTLEVKRLRKIVDVEIPQEEDISKSIKELDELTSKVSRLTFLKNSLLRYKKFEAVEIPSDEDVIGLQEDVKFLGHITRQHLLLTSLEHNLDSTKKVFKIEIPELVIDFKEIEKLKSLSNKIVVAAGDFKANKTEMSEVSVHFEALTQDLSKYKICPACGSNLENK